MPDLEQHAISIVQSLRAAGHQAYLVGGCVRDLLLGLEPADYDIATDASPDEVMGIFPRTYAVGAQFGVVLVPVANTERANYKGHEESTNDTNGCAAAESSAPAKHGAI